MPYINEKATLDLADMLSDKKLSAECMLCNSKVKVKYSMNRIYFYCPNCEEIVEFCILEDEG